MILNVGSSGTEFGLPVDTLYKYHDCKRKKHVTNISDFTFKLLTM